jgi:type IV secretory pathway TraG/TraD family ATPase VirD4
MINVKNMPKKLKKKFYNWVNSLKIYNNILLIIGTFSLASGTFSATIVMNRL